MKNKPKQPQLKSGLTHLTDAKHSLEMLFHILLRDPEFDKNTLLENLKREAQDLRSENSTLKRSLAQYRGAYKRKVSVYTSNYVSNLAAGRAKAEQIQAEVLFDANQILHTWLADEKEKVKNIEAANIILQTDYNTSDSYNKILETEIERLNQEISRLKREIRYANDREDKRQGNA